MPANNYPVFILTPKIGMARITTANTNRDGTGTLGDCMTGSTFGTRVDRIRIMATGTTTAGMVRFYIYDGTNNRLWRELAVTAITPSATVLGYTNEIMTPDTQSPLLVLPSASHILRASTHNGEQFDIVTHGGDF
jgi:hypothetical protein